jgi:hypothetical protein
MSGDAGGPAALALPDREGSQQILESRSARAVIFTDLARERLIETKLTAGEKGVG